MPDKEPTEWRPAFRGSGNERLLYHDSLPVIEVKLYRQQPQQAQQIASLIVEQIELSLSPKARESFDQAEAAELFAIASEEFQKQIWQALEDAYRKTVDASLLMAEKQLGKPRTKRGRLKRIRQAVSFLQDESTAKEERLFRHQVSIVNQDIYSKKGRPATQEELQSKLGIADIRKRLQDLGIPYQDTHGSLLLLETADSEAEIQAKAEALYEAIQNEGRDKSAG